MIYKRDWLSIVPFECTFTTYSKQDNGLILEYEYNTSKLVKKHTYMHMYMQLALTHLANLLVIGNPTNQSRPEAIWDVV